MESITENVARVGNFTSSEIHKLMTNGRGASGIGAPGLTYIQKKNIERRMGVSLKQEVYSRPMAWGELMELWVHEKELGLAYESVGKKTMVHPEYNYWAGSPDFVCTSKLLIAECKGYERENFATYADAILSGSTEILKTDCPDEYWQMVSNACIFGVDKVQPILFMPYKSQLMDIRIFADELNVGNPTKYRWIFESEDCQLPYLVDGGFYKNMVTSIIDVPKEDKALLTERVKIAAGMLNEFYKQK